MVETASKTTANARVERLKEEILNAKVGVSIDRARLETRVMKETEGEPMVTRRAKVFAAVAEEMPIHIAPDELIVGYFSGKRFCWNVSPSGGPTLENIVFGAQETEVKRLSRGVFTDRLWDYSVTDDEKRELKEELIPYWKGKGDYGNTVAGRSLALSGRARNQLIGHNCVKYEAVLEKGFLGIKKEAEERLARIDLSLPEEAAKIQFLKGVIDDMDAAARVGGRYSALARELAAKEDDAGRREELLKIADVCDQVPAHPARTFHEAVQSYFFTWILLFWEQPEVTANSPGGADQYLYSYYERDIDEGRITKEKAQELIDCYILKLNQIPNESLSTHLNVGGILANGKDATNPLSHMFIEAMMHTRMMSPIFSVQVHSKTPDDLLFKSGELCALGTGHPQFINHDVLVAQTLARSSLGGPPVTLADARSATPVGCVELIIPGKDAGWTGGTGLINYAACMEYVMTNGLRAGERVGPETGDPRQFSSFEEVVEAFRGQIAGALEKGKQEVEIHERTIAELAPTVFESALIDDCIERGICRELGGAHHNTSNQILPIGPSDAADSLTAIRKLVFEDKSLTLSELCDALEANFEGYEDLRAKLLKAPKYGNDDDYADEQANLVNHIVASEGAKIGKNIRGGSGGIIGGSAWWLFATAGRDVGALPSGRAAGEPTNDAHSPGAGFDKKGPTAVLKSMGKIDNIELMGGVVLNLRLDPAVIEKDDGVKKLADLIRAFVDQKIFHIQINVVSSDDLWAAQKEPEKYKDLMVKVAGYSVYFTQLTKPNQDAIIARTVHGM